MSRLNKFQFFSPDDSGGAVTPLTADGILDILNEPDDTDGDEIILNEKPTKKESKPEKEETEVGEGDEEDDDTGEKDEEGDELTELEEELELDADEKDEDELELITPVKRKEILSKYPTIFKDFPYLEKAYYREQKFSEIYPSINDAKDAYEKAQTLDNFERKILAGDISTILSVVKSDNQEAFNKLVDGYLPTLQRTDERAWNHVISSVVKPIIYHMHKEGTETKDDDLTAAAAVLNKFFYNTTKWEPHKPLTNGNGDGSPKQNEAETRLKAERDALFNERYTSARSDLSSRVESTFKKAIEKHIDPKSDMNDYVRKTAIREAYETLSESLSKDTRFKSVVDKAWRKAAENNFSKDSVEAIRRIINARAQTVLPTVIKKARTEALRGMGKRVKADTTTNEDSGRSASSNNRGPLKKAAGNSGSNNKQTEIPKGMSNRDFLMQD